MWVTDDNRLTFFESLGCVKLALWDEDQQRMISFRQARGHGSAA